MLRLLREPKAGCSSFWTVRLPSPQVIVSSYAIHPRNGQSVEGRWLIFVPPRGSAVRRSGLQLLPRWLKPMQLALWLLSCVFPRVLSISPHLPATVHWLPPRLTPSLRNKGWF